MKELENSMLMPIGLLSRVRHRVQGLNEDMKEEKACYG